MSKITAYVIKEHIGPFFLGLTTLIFVFILNIVFKDLGRLIGKGLSPLIIIEFFFLNMAWVAALAIPMAVLVSTLMAFGRLSADNEITAFKASGVNLYRLIAPVFIIAILMAVGMERFNNLVLPDFNYRVKMLSVDISRKKPTLTLEPHVFFNDIPNYSLLVHGIDEKTDELKNVYINDTSDPKFSRTIIAKSGTLIFSEEKERLVFSLFDGEIHEVENENYEQYRVLDFEKHIFSIEVSNMVLKRSENRRRGDREKSADMMREDVRKDRDVIAEREKRINKHAQADFETVFKEAYWRPSQTAADWQKKNVSGVRKKRPLERVQMTNKRIHSEMRVIQSSLKSISKRQVEIYKKYSIPVACIVFVLIGAPLGIMARQGGLAMGWGFSILFFFIYWTFLIGGEQLADRMIINPMLSMWLPNIVVGAIGVYLVIHTVHEVHYFPRWTRWSFKEFLNQVKKKNDS